MDETYTYPTGHFVRVVVEKMLAIKMVNVHEFAHRGCQIVCVKVQQYDTKLICSRLYNQVRSLCVSQLFSNSQTCLQKLSTEDESCTPSIQMKQERWHQRQSCMWKAGPWERKKQNQGKQATIVDTIHAQVR